MLATLWVHTAEMISVPSSLWLFIWLSTWPGIRAHITALDLTGGTIPPAEHGPSHYDARDDPTTDLGLCTCANLG